MYVFVYVYIHRPLKRIMYGSLIPSFPTKSQLKEMLSAVDKMFSYLVGQWYPFALCFGSRFPSKVANNKKGTLTIIRVLGYQGYTRGANLKCFSPDGREIAPDSTVPAARSALERFF